MPKDSNRHFSKEGNTNSKCAHENMFSIFREMQIRTAMRHHFTHIRMASIKNQNKTKT
jgi:hypothetical protein